MDKNIKKLLKDSIIYIIFIILITLGGIYFLIPKAKNVIANNKTLQTKEEEFENLEREVEELTKIIEQKQQQEKEKEDTPKNSIEKPIFKTNNISGDSFSANAPLFEDIIKILKANKLKLVSIENKVSGFDDAISQNGQNQYNICLIDMQLLGSYSHFQKFLTFLYDYPYLINIKSIEIVPFDKDKNILIINMSIILYSEPTDTIQEVIE